MNFQDLAKVENPDFYLDVAFRRAKEAAERAKVSFKTKHVGERARAAAKGRGRGKGQKFAKQRQGKPGHEMREETNEKILRARYVELVRVDVVKDTLCNFLENLLKKFPQINDLPKFYYELVRCTLEYDDLKNSLGSINWAVIRLQEFHRKYHGYIRATNDVVKTGEYRTEFYGRAASVMKQIKRQLAYCEESRKIMKEYPNVKTSVTTIAIVGFPNVGKTTLMYKLTGSKPEINSYAFTTKGINVGYIGRDKSKRDRIQVLDTPGTLNRFEKMNNIEKQAYLAMRFVADAFVYVFDLSEPYPLEKQMALYEGIKELDKEIIIYLSKSDILAKEKMQDFIKKYDCVVSIDELKKRIEKVKKVSE